MLTRRGVMELGLACSVAALLPWRAGAEVPTLDEMRQAFTSGAATEAGGLELNITELAENGASVPVELRAPEGAVALMMLMPGNFQPHAFTARFGPAAGSPRLATRIRLAQSQEVIALAEMADGRFLEARKHVDVTLGGCITG
ncbi:thiosulfate oxidation carrier protein SoxY [Alkalilacustris brevis]|uniref:thiosulfate oxidation carrier protein SoxY n=1 Tax=Alkalilacustris brevis TaxID=2026338 RepID=UPI000E0D52EA|nr:thiosulfate oxidation carrier protein SoxY [Alkalilacustris brevis]